MAQSCAVLNKYNLSPLFFFTGNVLPCSPGSAPDIKMIRDFVSLLCKLQIAHVTMQVESWLITHLFAFCVPGASFNGLTWQIREVREYIYYIVATRSLHAPALKIFSNHSMLACVFLCQSRIYTI